MSDKDRLEDELLLLCFSPLEHDPHGANDIKDIGLFLRFCNHVVRPSRCFEKQTLYYASPKITLCKREVSSFNT